MTVTIVCVGAQSARPVRIPDIVRDNAYRSNEIMSGTSNVVDVVAAGQSFDGNSSIIAALYACGHYRQSGGDDIGICLCLVLGYYF